jgi:hypothetical protein
MVTIKQYNKGIEDIPPKTINFGDYWRYIFYFILFDCTLFWLQRCHSAVSVLA